MRNKLIAFAFFQNLSVRLEEVEANAVVGAKRIISKMEARIRDLELELEEEKRRHAETIKILRKKERTVKEIVIQCEEDQKTALLLQESLDKANAKINIYKRQLNEQVTRIVLSGANEQMFKIYELKLTHSVVHFRRVCPHSLSPALVASSANWRPLRTAPRSPNPT